MVIAVGHSDSRPHHTHTNNKSTSESIYFMTSNLGTHTVDSPAMRSIDLLAVPRRWGIIIFSDEVAPTAVHLWSPKGYGCCYSPNQDIVAGGVLGEPQRTIPPTSVDLYWVLGGSKDCPTSGFLTPTHPTNILYQIYLYMSSFFRFSFRSFSWKYFHCGLRDSSHFRFCSFMMILSSLICGMHMTTWPTQAVSLVLSC